VHLTAIGKTHHFVPELSLFAVELPGQRHAFLHAVIGVVLKMPSNGLEHAAANVVLVAS